MALAAAAIKAHFQGGGAEAGAPAPVNSDKARKLFRESNAEAFGETGPQDDEEASSSLPSSAAAAGGASLDRQLTGVETLLQMQSGGGGRTEAGESVAADKMGMKEKQALLNAMFTARMSVSVAPPKAQSDDTDGEESLGDSMSDVSDDENGTGEDGAPDGALRVENEALPTGQVVAEEEEEEEEWQGMPSVPDQRILAIVNSFVVNASKLVNRVCVLSEKQLADIDRGIHKLQVILTLLERKLKSVDGLEPGQAPAAAVAEGAQGGSTANAAGTGGGDGEAHTKAGDEEAGGTVQTGDGGDQPSGGESSNMVKASDHPVYSRYFKMLKMGVVELAVKQKMQSEGLDAGVIDRGAESMVEL